MNIVEKFKDLMDFPGETEVVEWKKAEKHFDFNELGKYFSALSNEANLKGVGEAWLIFGVTNDKNISGTEYRNDRVSLDRLKHEISQLTTNRISFIDIFEIKIDKKRIILFQIPQAPRGFPIEWKGHYYARQGESLVPLDIVKLEKIRSQVSKEDWSAQTCPEATVSDLDSDAIKQFRSLYEDKHGSDSQTLSDEDFLSDLDLISDKKISFTALILFGTKKFLDKYLPDAEIVFEYRNLESDIKYVERINFRESLLKSLNKIWNKIGARNSTFQFQSGLIRKEILAFNEEVVREALLNSVIHRDYGVQSSIFILQSPESIVFKSPGGLPQGITIENMHKKNFWRNRRLAETFEKIGLVERSGQGVDLIFDRTIKEGKGMPDYSGTDDNEVVLKISATIKDEDFVSYLEDVSQKKQMIFSVDDLIVLEKIKDGDQKDFVKEDVQKFLDAGVVISIGRGRGTKYLLSKEYYKNKKSLGEYMRLQGIGREKIKMLILDHIEKNSSINTQELRQGFPELTAKDIDNILQELRRSGKIVFEGTKRDGRWVLGKN